MRISDPASTVPSSSAEIRGGASRELTPVQREHLATKVPLDEKAFGLVWRRGLGGKKDSLGVYLPGFSTMSACSSRPKEGLSHYAREAMRVTELPYIREWVAKYPEQAVNTAMANAYELCNLVGYMKDELERLKGTLRVPKVRPEMVSTAIRERDFWKSCAEEDHHKRKLVEERLEVKDREMELMKQKLDAVTGDLESANARIASLEAEVAKSSPEAVASRFLQSNAFREAAPLSCLGFVRAAIHAELAKVGEYYPCAPDQFGFPSIPIDQALPQNLVGYKWDVEQDALIGPGGQLVQADGFTLPTCEAPGPVYIWGEAHWPKDLYVYQEPEPIEEDGEEAEDTEVDAETDPSSPAT